MATAMKGIFRGLKIIAQIFTVQREHEIEIGYPTDVRHVSHVGLGASDSCPSWMSEFRGVEEVTAEGLGASIVGSAAQSRHSSWASLDFEQPASTGVVPPTESSAADSGSGQDGGGSGTQARCGSSSGPATTKKQAAARPRKGSRSRAASPGRSSSWRSTASFDTACDGHSCELRVPAGMQAA